MKNSSSFKFNQYIFTIFFLFLSSIIFAQEKEVESQVSEKIMLEGKVIDNETGETIPYCSIIIDGTYIGTSTNEEGEYLIYVDSIPVTLIFSHLSFKQITVTVETANNQLIALTPYLNKLSTIAIGVKRKKDRYAFDLAKKALYKMRELASDIKYGQALYRQKSKIDENYTEFSEIIYDIAYNSKGIERWDIIEGRYALNEIGLKNKNYTLLSKILKSLQPETDDILFPLGFRYEEYYDVRVKERYQTDAGEIVVLKFDPYKFPPAPIFAGEISVNATTFEVLKVSGEVINDELELIRITGKKTEKKNYKLSYDMVFKKDSLLGLVLDYVKVDQEFDYYNDGNLQSHFSTTSNLLFFEHYNPITKKRLGRQFRHGRSDWDKLNRIGYNEKFWEDNPIVKRTPVEQEVIASFEKDNAFETIFLNSKERIASLQSNISGEPFIEQLTKSLIKYNSERAVEKVHLHTNKDLFLAGDYLWYSAYVVLGPAHYLTAISKNFQVDLISPTGEIIVSQLQGLNNGRGSGSLQLPDDLKEGTYQLRAYTNWMNNFQQDFFYTKRINVLSKEINEVKELSLVSSNSSSEIDLQFFPEGGDAIAGLTTKVAFKAIGVDGLPKYARGKVVDANGSMVSSINTLDRGSGFFTLLPKAYEQYKAILNDKSEYLLPKVKNEGYSLLINNTHPKNINIKVKASESLRDKPFYVIGTLRTLKYFQAKFEFNEEEVIEFEVPKNKLPSGVMTFTILDEEMQPWAERAVFINNQEELVITTKLDKESYQPREKVKLEIQVLDNEGRPTPTTLSVAITDTDKLSKNPYASNIITNLLLESELKGYIINPEELLQDQKRATLSKLDLVMLTNGWRRFNWQDVQKDSLPLPKHLFAQGFSISGKVTRSESKRPFSNSKLNVIAQSKTKLDMHTTTTKEDGRFIIDNIHHLDSVKFIFRAYNTREKEVPIAITLDKQETHKWFVPTSNFSYKKPKKESNTTKERITLTQKEQEQFIVTSKMQQEINKLYNPKETIVLHEVEVLGKVREKEKQNQVSHTFHLEPDTVVNVKENPTEGFLNQLANAPNVKIRGVGINTKVSINGYSNPLWVVDGVVISQVDIITGKGQPTTEDLASPTMQPAGPIPTEIAMLNSHDIDRIEILKGAKAALYGMRGNNGVIIVYTKQGSFTPEPPPPTENYAGYTVKKEFYNPKYDVPEDIHSRPDVRTTIYWNAIVETNKDGKAFVEFFNSDTAEEFEISIEALSIYGLPGKLLNKK